MTTALASFHKHRNVLLIFAALIAAMLFSKVVYYTMKYVALSADWLTGNLVSTPVQTQLVLATGTAVVFGLIEHYRPGNKQR